MSRSLKDFMNENRQAFDDEQPGEHNWDRIAGSVPMLKNSRGSYRKLYTWAGAAAVLVIAAAIYWSVQEKPADKSMVKGNKISNDIRTLAPEYAASAEPIYRAIEKQQRELKDLSKAQPELYDQFTEDLATLDSSYRVLKAQATKSPNREILIRAMMNNLQLQAELLSRQLNILNEFNNNNNQKSDDHDKKKSYSSL